MRAQLLTIERWHAIVGGHWVQQASDARSDA
jgi:hypothetical protein